MTSLAFVLLHTWFLQICFQFPNCTHLDTYQPWVNPTPGGRWPTMNKGKKTSEPFADKWKWKSLHYVRLFATPWTGTHQAPLPMEFSRQEYWSGVPFPTPGAKPTSLVSPALVGRFCTASEKAKQFIIVEVFAMSVCFHACTHTLTPFLLTHCLAHTPLTAFLPSSVE